MKRFKEFTEAKDIPDLPPLQRSLLEFYLVEKPIKISKESFKKGDLLAVLPQRTGPSIFFKAEKKAGKNGFPLGSSFPTKLKDENKFNEDLENGKIKKLSRSETSNLLKK